MDDIERSDAGHRCRSRATAPTGQDVLAVHRTRHGITAVFNARRRRDADASPAPSPCVNYQTLRCGRSPTPNTSSNPPTPLAPARSTFIANDGDTARAAPGSDSDTIDAVTAVNDAPVLRRRRHAYSTVGNTQLHVQGATLPGLASVSDASGALLKAVVSDIDGPAVPVVVAQTNFDTGEGTLTINADGSFTYVPDAGFTGIDTFTVQVTDTARP